MRRRARLVGVIVLLGAVAGAQDPAEPGPSGPVPIQNYDCGTMALFVLLRLEGRPVTLERLAAQLPAPTTEGYSLAELRDAARHFGLRLRGVRLRDADVAAGRPALAFVRREGHGHYAVLRPVGHTGKLVQVIDPNRVPEVLDAADLPASPGWTGMALVPDRSPTPLVVVAVVCGSIALVTGILWHRARRRGVGVCPV